MARVFISYSQRDQKIALELSQKLREAGHTILTDLEIIYPGSEWQKTIYKNLEISDVVVALITENFLESPFAMREIISTMAFVNSIRWKKILIPVVLGDIEIPHEIQGLQAIISNPPNLQNAFEKVIDAIDYFLGRKAAEEEKEREIKKEIEATASEYIEEAILELKQRESDHKNDAKRWYQIGWGSLVIGIVVAIVIAIIGYINFNHEFKWQISIFLAFKGIIIVTLLIASSKYAFGLAKSYMSESLKNADRIHAISFGKFFLKSYGENVATSEIKEVFQHWNINSNSSFSTQNPNDFDPKFIESILAIAEVVKQYQNKKE